MSYKSKIVYNPLLSVKENAVNNHVTVAAIRWYIRANGIDRRLDNGILIKRKLSEIKDSHTNISIRELSKLTGHSINTVKKYLHTDLDELNNDSSKLSMFNTRKQRFIIKSVSDSQDVILSNILRLYIKQRTFDCDLTYSIGNFYLHLPKPNLRYDKYPQSDDVKSLSEVTQITENSLHSVVIDLPFVVKSEKNAEHSKIAQRFSHFNTLNELLQTNIDMLQLAWRLLSKDGFLVYKTMDLLLDNKQIWLGNYVQNKAFEIGFNLEDMFILTAKTRMIRTRGTIQRHARKFHSYFFVFSKNR